MPSARAASHWPRSTETMPPRNTSAKNAADWIEKVSTAAMNGVISTPIRIGSAKKNQNSWTSGGVVRKTSMTEPAGHEAKRCRDSRISASAPVLLIYQLYATMRYIDSKVPTVATVKERNDVSHGMASMGISS